MRSAYICRRSYVAECCDNKHYEYESYDSIIHITSNKQCCINYI